MQEVQKACGPKLTMYICMAEQELGGTGVPLVSGEFSLLLRH
jgi:hypothetical protein